MSGTVSGGRRTAATNKSRYGENYYQTIGRLGGQISRGGGFAKNRELAREAGRMGGLVTQSNYFANETPERRTERMRALRASRRAGAAKARDIKATKAAKAKVEQPMQAKRSWKDIFKLGNKKELTK